MTIGPPGKNIPRVARRFPGRARPLSRVPVWAAIADSRSQAPEQAASARQRMREFMRRRGGRGVTITMIVNRLASEKLDVPKITVGRWLAEDIKHRVAERDGRGRYRLRQRGDAG